MMTDVATEPRKRLTRREEAIARIIADYRCAYEAANGKPINVVYAAGWFHIGDDAGFTRRWRGAQLEDFTIRLKDRAWRKENGYEE